MFGLYLHEVTLLSLEGPVREIDRIKITSHDQMKLMITSLPLIKGTGLLNYKCRGVTVSVTVKKDYSNNVTIII